MSHEELFDLLHGNWASTMKVMEYKSFHYEVDSTLFHTEGRRLGIVFSSKGNFQKTFEGKEIPYVDYQKAVVNYNQWWEIIYDKEEVQPFAIPVENMWIANLINFLKINL